MLSKLGYIYEKRKGNDAEINELTKHLDNYTTDLTKVSNQVENLISVIDGVKNDISAIFQIPDLEKRLGKQRALITKVIEDIRNIDVKLNTQITEIERKFKEDDIKILDKLDLNKQTFEESLTRIGSNIPIIPEVIELKTVKYITGKLKFRKINESCGVLTGFCQVNKPSFETSSFTIKVCDIQINSTFLGVCINGRTKQAEMFGIRNQSLNIEVTNYQPPVEYIFNCIIQ